MDRNLKLMLTVLGIAMFLAFVVPSLGEAAAPGTPRAQEIAAAPETPPADTMPVVAMTATMPTDFTMPSSGNLTTPTGITGAPTGFDVPMPQSGMMAQAGVIPQPVMPPPASQPSYTPPPQPAVPRYRIPPPSQGRPSDVGPPVDRRVLR